ncbi:DUF438 domain-containing protein [Clostridium sp. Marseille-P299]|uniref:DUF438 domain-containing protein n=1 Tax=Clostridium sp. Marseille-P299 TaxID=1805477 RepID=UPI000829D142|nr:DUF438 domain-containing protein [Clostridium sp. Marseille-P299]
MSAEINNREFRKEKLKEIISQLHEGKSVEEVRDIFATIFHGVSADEISQAEQALISEGLPITEVQRLCDVHASVFKGSIEEIHQPKEESDIPGHPAYVLKQENRALEKLIHEIKNQLSNLPANESVDALAKQFENLFEIDRHYKKKENIFFPYMEKYGITAPPMVMWGVDDEIREQLKEIKAKIEKEDLNELKNYIETVLHRIEEMIFKEENILLPILHENLTIEEWVQIAKDSVEFGYCLLDHVPEWKPTIKEKQEKEESNEANNTEVEGTIKMPTGVLNVEELVRIFDTLPVDITFVDKNDTVKYFSQGKERVFPRTVSVIGRNVSNCHPPASVHIVEKIVEDFKTGRKDREDFWLHLGDKYILISYFAVRSDSGDYLGVLEVTQNIKSIQEITGEKRLVSE